MGHSLKHLLAQSLATLLHAVASTEALSNGNQRVALV
jgi:hypothetical protein